MKRWAVASLLGVCAVVQLVVLIGRAGGRGPLTVPSYALGDTLDWIAGRSADGSGDTLAMSTPDGSVTVFYAFSSDCAHSDGVAPEWADHFADGFGEGVTRVAVTRDRREAAVQYANRFGWQVRILSDPDLPTADRRRFFLSRTPWLYVFDRRGVLRFQGHGSELNEMREVAMKLSAARTGGP